MKFISVKVVKRPTIDDLRLVIGAARMTQERGALPDAFPFSAPLLKRLIDLGHTSCLEHADFGVVIIGASRVFLAQITRHRLASYTSGSQQYQKHHNFQYVVPEELEGEPGLLNAYCEHMRATDALYAKLETYAGRDIARYILPNAARNNLLMKGNLREWFCTIFPQRLCKRNTPETRYIMGMALRGFLELPPREQGHLPTYEAFCRLTGPACITRGACDQGSMCCGAPFGSWEEMLP